MSISCDVTSAIAACSAGNDGDTDYGGLLNVDFTVRGYEAAGAQAIQIEDQEYPKKWSHARPPMGAALKSIYEEILSSGSSKSWKGELYPFDDFSRLMGFERIWAFEREHLEL